ncbi:MAG: FmdE family protein [Thermodesulfobacteriota bacterium]|nr:FmdE family protein [Thermodesulfobacteriota bacterium]
MVMQNEEILRSIDRKELEFIRRSVKVDYDNRLQRPLSFSHQNKEHKVTELLGTFKGDLSSRDISYLVKTQDGGIYLLYLRFHDPSPQSFACPCHWILDFRVLSDEEMMFFFKEERKMLVNMQLKRVVDFHGHLCPDLVIGCKTHETAMKTLACKENLDGGLIVIAENKTSAIDAIQCLSGCTLGNQRLKVHDFGKHKYTFFVSRTGLEVKLSLKEQNFRDEPEFLDLEEKAEKGEATVDDIARFQRLLDERVKMLLSLRHDALFDTVITLRKSPRIEMFTDLARCDRCRDLVLKSRLVNIKGFSMCRQCFSYLTLSSIDGTRH